MQRLERHLHNVCNVGSNVASCGEISLESGIRTCSGTYNANASASSSPGLATANHVDMSSQVRWEYAVVELAAQVGDRPRGDGPTGGAGLGRLESTMILVSFLFGS